jgi:tetratricopeptide (TPR) repeat protein
MLKKWLFLVVIVSAFLSAAGAQEKDIYELPSWLILEYGRKAFSEKELGVALRYAREAIEKEGRFFPEAEILIGDVFRGEGNTDLAIEQYEKALESARQLYVRNDKYKILYKIADIYRDGEPETYEATLRRVLEDDETYNQAVKTDLGGKMITALRNEGLNKLLVLYRLQSYHSLEAHTELGRLYSEQGQWEMAALHLIFSVVTVFSRCIEEYKMYDPEYIFEDADVFLRLTKRYTAIQEYIEHTGLFVDLYYLGAVLQSLGAKTETVRTIWETALRHTGAPRLQNRLESEVENL